MGNSYGGCAGCGGVPVPVSYPVGTGIAPPLYGGYGGVVDADPITPGIQTRPGVVTPVGPPTIVGGNPGFIGGPGYVAGGVRPGGFGVSTFGRDVDPITPGVQTRPGVVTATGPSTFVGGAPFRRF